jgi:hypothetical protein
MQRLALCLILAIVFAQPASAKNPLAAKDIVCGWLHVAGRDSHFACHIAGAPGAPDVAVRVEDLTPTPEIVALVARTLRGSAIDPRLVLAVIAAESGFDRRAVSPKNAMGLMQLMPETVARFGVRDPFDAEENVRAGASYLLLLLRKYGNLERALAAYNAGEGPVIAYGAVPPYQETMDYVGRVLHLYARYQNMFLERREPVRAVAAAAAPRAQTAPRAARADGVGGCGLVCRGNRLAAQLDDIASLMPVSPRQPDASWSGAASVASARAN